MQEHTDNRSSSSRCNVYRSAEDINALVNSLNKNGRREGQLYTNIKNMLKECGIELADGKKSLPSSSTVRNEIHEEVDETVEETLERVKEYVSIYQPQEDYLKPRARVNRNMQLLEIYRDKVHKSRMEDRATSSFLMELLLELENVFASYLRTRKCRWIEKSERESLRKEAHENMSESKVAGMLIMMNNRFIHIETFMRRDEESNNEDNSENEENDLFSLKKRKNKLWKNDRENSDDEKEDGDDDFETDTSKYYMKRKVLKTWGFYNERFKQAWENFVSNVEANHIGALYLGAAIFIEIIFKYISRKHLKVAVAHAERRRGPGRKAASHRVRQAGRQRGQPPPQQRVHIQEEERRANPAAANRNSIVYREVQSEDKEPNRAR